MNLAPREKRTILIGLVVVGVVGSYLGVTRLGRLVRSAGSGGEQKKSQFFDASARIKRYGTVGSELKKLTDSLRIEIPTDSPPDQMKNLVEKFDSFAQRSNVQIRNITQMKPQTRTAAARGPVPLTEIKLDVTCPNYAGLVRFVDNLEQATVPIIVDQVSVTSVGGRAGGGGGPSPRGPKGGEGGQKRQLQASLKILTYLFPERTSP